VIAGEEIMIEEVDQDYPCWTEEMNENEFYAEVKRVRDYLLSEANSAIKSLK
jgi:hypothetical protein